MGTGPINVSHSYLGIRVYIQMWVEWSLGDVSVAEDIVKTYF